MSMSKRERLILLAVLVIAGLFLADRWLLSPLWESYQGDVNRAGRLQGEVFQTQTLLRHRREIETTWRQRQEAGVASEVSLAESQLLNRLEQWAGEARLSVSSMKPEREPVKKGAIVQRVRCRMIVGGNMESVARFCHRLETADFPVRLELMQFSSVDSRKDGLTVQFVVSTVCLVPPATTVAARSNKQGLPG